MTTPRAALPTEPRPEHPMELRGTVLVILASLAAFGPVALDVYLPSFPSIADSFGVAVAEVQITFSACLIGLGVGQLLWGPLSDRFGRRGPLLIGLGVYSLASLACILAPNLAALTVARAFMGLGGCAGIVISRAVTRDCFSGVALAKSMSVVSTVMMISPLIAPSIGALVMNFFTWRAAFVVTTAFGLLCIVGTLMLPETHPSHHRTEHGVVDAVRAYFALIRAPRFIVPAVVGGLVSSSLLIWISSSSVIFMGDYELSTWGFVIVFAISTVAIMVGMRLNIKLVDRCPPHTLLTIYSAWGGLSAIALIPMFLTGVNVALVVAVISILLVAVGASMPLAAASAMQPFPRAAGSASAIFGLLMFGFAGVFSSILSGLSFAPGPELAVALTGVTLAAFALSFIRPRQG